MRRKYLWATLAVVPAVALAMLFILKPSTSAEPGKGAANPGAIKPAVQLPIGQVVLFSSGVGYFQREGEIDGNTRIDLTFPVEDINDLLKSMVLQDLGDGHISAVSYESHDPVEKTLKSFAVNLTSNPGLGQIMQQARGEKVEVVMQQSSAAQPGTLTGTVIGLEKQRQPAGKDGVVETEMLNMWCAEGMRSVKLADVQRIRFLNPVIESEFRRALDVLALSHDTQKKAVSLNFTGDGKRAVRVGYVVENPIWKTSYRLVIGKDGKPFLQGWAVVENPSDEDWSNVRMALVSGRPISFRMDLYQPLYIPRPVVEPELFASLRPQTYSGGMGMMGGGGGGVQNLLEKSAAEYKKNADRADGKARSESRALKELAGRPAGGYGFGAGKDKSALALDEQGDMDLKRGVASAATAAEMGDFFQYVIDQPVNLPRQKSAMLPIVQKEIEGTKVSIYNERTHAKFPLLGLKFKNTTGLHLMQGPITVFEQNSYAGDARILDLQPNEERLLSYAIDLGTEVEAKFDSPPQRLIKVKIDKGLLYSTNKTRESKTYNIKNRSEHDRTVLIEHPYRGDDFKLVSKEKPIERARDVYRFQVDVAKGKSASQTVTEERDITQAISLSNSDDQTIRIFQTSNVSSAKVQDALKRALELKNKLSATQRDLQKFNQQLADITNDQTRLRANLKEMPPTAAAYKRYLDKFDKQETQIEELQAQIKKLQETEHEQRREYETYLSGLTIE